MGWFRVGRGRIKIRTSAAVGVALATVAASVLVSASPASAVGTTYTVTSTYGCQAVGSFEWAVQQANANPGKDTINFASGLDIDYLGCQGRLPGRPYGVNVTESVDINGNGAYIEGNQLWADQNGVINNTAECPGDVGSNAHWIAISTGFLDIGTPNADNTGVEVTAQNLLFDNLPSLVKVEENATFTMTDSTASHIDDFNEGCNRAPILATEPGADVTLRRFFLNSSVQPNAVIQEFNSSALVFGGTGDLVMDHVTFDANSGGFAVEWGDGVGTAGTVKIVTSKLFLSGGLSLSGTASDVVNTALAVDSRSVTDRALSWGGTATATASTFVWRWPTCSDPLCGSTNPGFGVRGSGTWTFVTTAIGAGADYPSSGPMLNGTSSNMSSDTMTWAQPTDNQDAAAINAILPSALTAAEGLASTDSLISSVEGITPLLGSLSTPGKLIDVVPEATCSGVNVLINPIDSTCITEDVLGNDRWSTGNSTRNIGAVQTVGAPHLTVAGVGDQTVHLAWNRPSDPAGATVTGYLIFYRISGSSDTPTAVPVSGAGTLTHAVTGLTNGTRYVFTIVATTTGSNSVSSNEVLATPFAPIALPVLAPRPGNGQASLSWSVASAGGHPGPLSYFVMYRPVGSHHWSSGPHWLSASTTTITGLTNHTPYEFGVFATSTDGTASRLGTARTTPSRPAVAQRPLKGCAVVPAHLPANGRQVLTHASCVTNAGNRVHTSVTCRSYNRGDVRYCTVIRGPRGRVSIVTNGHNGAIHVVWWASASAGYKKYRKARTY